MDLTKNTKEGEKRSAIVKMAKNKVPKINPNCMAEVTCTKKSALKFSSLAISPIIEFPANHKVVHKN